MARPPLVVGLPCHRRHWILDEWFSSLEAQDPPDGTRLIFLLSEPGDPSERVILRRWPAAEVLYAEGLPAFGEDEKADPRRYAVLAHLRNRLLRAVAALAPERYLSWDSDILLEPGALSAMRSLGKDAVGALVDMGGEALPGQWSWMELSGRDAFRLPSLKADGTPRRRPLCIFDENAALPRAWPTYDAPFRVGVIMGCKLLSPRAYRDIRYVDHPLGEDVGWAIQAESMGIERWLCPAARGVHRYRHAASV